MTGYIVVRDWVDRCWRSIGQWRLLALPPALIGLVLLAFGLDGAAVWISFSGFFIVWNAFVFWRWSIYMRVASADADRKYDKIGKFKLSREYWGTESATSATARKRKNG